MGHLAMSDTYRYWAFVSYSRHDSRVARLLVRELTAVPVPRERRTTVAGSPATFAPLFLDTRDAAAAPELDGELQRALRDSVRVIVLCSPFAVQSGYVADEIRYFQSLGRGADILCLIVSGEPDATDRGQPALECFPAPLRVPAAGPDQRPPRPLAAALGHETPQEWRAALEQIAAGLTGQTLAQWRDGVSQRRTRQRALVGAAMLALAGLAWAGAWAWWLPQQLHAKHAVRLWGALQPVDEIPANQAAQRPSTYRFERRGAFGHWTTVRAVDSSGRCTDDGKQIQSLVGEAFKLTCTRSRACAVKVTLANGRIASEQVLDQHGQVLETVSYSDERHAVLTEAVVGCSRREGNIEFVQIERHGPDSGPLAGLDRELRFFGGEDKSPRPNSGYAFGWRISHDAKRRVNLRELLGPDGRPRPGREGYTAMRLVHNSAGDVIEETMLGPDGQPVDARSGYATLRREVDGAGRETAIRSFDAAGLQVHDERGRYGKRSAYDERGRPVDLFNLGADDRPAPDADGVAHRRITYGATAGELTSRYFDAAGQPVPEGDFGCAVVAHNQPPDLRWAERRCLDGQGRPAYSKQGWHLVRTTFGERGQEVSDAFFDISGQPTLCIDEDMSCPHHRSENTFDERGNAVSSRMFDVSGAPAVTATGVSRIDLEHDSRNRVRLTVNRGPDGQPARSREQTVAVANVYDIYGRQIERRRVGPDGQPLLLGLKTYARRIEYDALGNEVLEETLDVAGQRVGDDLGDGYAAVRKRFDPRGHAIELRFFDQRDRPTADRQGWYGFRTTRDRWGRETAQTRLGPDGHPQPGPDGELERRIERNPRGHVVRLSLHGADGRLLPRADGVAQWIWTVDLTGHRTSERRLGPASQPVADREGLIGHDDRLDERGHVVEHRRIGPDGQIAGDRTDGIARITGEVDALGRVGYKRFFNRDGQPRANGSGSHGYAFRYNARGQVLETQHLGADDRPANNQDGVARVESDYDNAGGMTEQRFYGADGRPSTTAQAAIVRHRTDASGRELERSFFDATGQPVESPSSGRWRVVLKRDVWGRLLDEESQGKDGQPVNRRDEGWSRRILQYGNMGELASVRCLDVRGQPVKPCKQSE